MKMREQISKELRLKRDKQIIADYMKKDEDGKFVLKVKQIAEKYKVSVPLVYKILEKQD